MASPFDKFLIAPINSGLQKDAEPWMIPDDAFERLENAYVFRGKVRKRFGSTFTGYGYASSTEEQLFSRLRIALPSSSASVGTTDGVTGNLSGTVAGASGAIGQQFVIGIEVFTVVALGTPGVMTTTGAATVHTFNTTTGAFVIEGATIGTECFFYSSGIGTTRAAGTATGIVPGAVFKVGQMFSIGSEIFTVSVTGTPGTMLSAGASVSQGTTNAAGDLSGTVTGFIFKAGQTFTIGDETCTVPGLGNPVVMTTDGGSTTHTFDTTTGAFVIVGSEASTSVYFHSTSDTYTYNTTTGAFEFDGAQISTQIYFYPAEPVMGLTQLETNTLGSRSTVAFDTQYAYEYSGGFWGRIGPTLPARWNGNNSHFFWSVNWRGASMDTNLLFTSNYHADVPTAVAATDDPIRYYDGATWTDFNPDYLAPVAPAVIADRILTAKIIIPFKDRLVLLSTIEQNAAGTINTKYTNRCRYSHNGSPLSATAWYEQNQVGATGAGWVDAPTKEQIISAEFIKDRLIVYFEQSTWELVYTSNQILPFVWQQLDSELGSQSKHSTVSFDKAAITIGARGIHACNGANTSRIDQKIPNEVFKIRTADDGVKRVAGARDFYTEMIYWTFPKSDADADADVYPNKVLVYNYKNGSWAFNDDCITAFGAFEQQEGMTWETAGDLTWAEADFAWGSGVSQAKFKQVIAGNQQGFVFILMPDVASNAAVMQISLATYVGNILTLTIRDHTIQNGQWIKLFNMNGLTITGTGIYQVTVVDADTVSVVVNTEIPVAITGTYIGGGTASRVSNINILSKQWNFYMKEARGIYLSQIDFIVRKTTNGEITVNYYPSTSSLDLIDEATTTDTLIGTNILETSPHALVGLEETQDRLIHRVYFSGEGNCVQIHFYLSPAQIADPDIAESDFQLEGMVVYTMRTGDI